ncbi:DUF5080 family protein [Staphylococcus massiliensis]|uniref:DUF5080 family protein n=1 Tax=Staphylococcus massiliensis TaxID=555791 RepID=UPI001EE08864|nr:DUF5080 family protein [Staphylococcus massiliensis]MCG3399550.1 DUF5080 family protein [Staphylococcus massiliensis]MCG3402060.1 DUF5080 family protein [Staphylococcus massiliensis]
MFVLILVSLVILLIGCKFIGMFRSEEFPYCYRFTALGIILLIVFYFIVGFYQKENDLGNYTILMYYGSLYCMYYAIRNLWNKDLKVERAKLLEEGDKEGAESKTLSIQICRTTGLYSMMAAILLFIIDWYHTNEKYQLDTLDFNYFLIALCIFVFVVRLLIDVYKKFKHGVFYFIAVRSLVVTIWLIFTHIILDMKY